MPYRLAYRVEVIFSIEALRLLFTNNSRYKNKRLKKKKQDLGHSQKVGRSHAVL